MVEKQIKKRKRRNDRNHIVYQMTCKATGDTYVGISAMIGQARLRTLNERFRRHLSRAIHEGKDWSMHEMLRKYPDKDQWEKKILQIVRGRKNAHQAERKMIVRIGATLNTF